MIEIVPSISIMKGKCVKLAEGSFNKIIEYEKNPIDLAQEFEAQGIQKIHLVDLEGAKKGRAINLDILGLIAGHTNLHINFAGGINTDGDYAKVKEYGASSVTIGSMAINNPDLFCGWLISYGRENLALSADSHNGKISIKGWQKLTEKGLIEHIEYFYNRGILYVKCSDITKESLMKGPAFSIYENITERFPGIRIYASGGITSVEDVEYLNEIGVYGAIIGRAFYEKKISIKDLKKFVIKD